MNARAEYSLTLTSRKKVQPSYHHKECFRGPYFRQHRICQRWSGCGLGETFLVWGLAYRKWVSNDPFLLALCVDICYLWHVISEQHRAVPRRIKRPFLRLLPFRGAADKQRSLYGQVVFYQYGTPRRLKCKCRLVTALRRLRQTFCDGLRVKST